MDIDLAYTLPSDWRARFSRAAFPSEVQPLADALRAVVRAYGDTAILVTEIQQFVLWAIGHRETDTFAPYLQILGTLTRAGGGTWPLEYPLQERNRQWSSRKSVVELAGDLRAVHGEWSVLYHAVTRGCTPVPHRDQQPRTEDWFVETDDTKELYLEAKSKGQLGHLRELLASATRGLAMLPDAQFMRDYDWRAHAPDSTRSGELLRTLTLFVDDLREVEALLAKRAEGRTSRGLIVTALDAGRWGISGSGPATLSVAPSSAPRFQIVTTSEGAFIPQELGAEHEKGVRVFAGRLGIKKPLDPNTLFVVAWPVPWTWDHAITRPWAEQVWEKISKEMELPAAALWPRGVFNAPSVWIPNKPARDLLGAQRGLWG